MKKATTKFQLKRDGEQFGMVYDLHREAKEAAERLVECGWIKEYEVIPIKSVWLNVGR
jgi:hypothetical protein